MRALPPGSGGLDGHSGAGRGHVVRQELGRLDELSRARFGHYPTPLEAMPNLAATLGRDGGLYVKRDDCTGLAFGGNKVRQLEFYLGEAEAAGADTVLITGAVQSNFVRSAAAAAAVLGMKCHIQLEERVPKNDPLYRNSGNVLLDKILGATLHSYPHGEDEAGADAQVDEEIFDRFSASIAQGSVVRVSTALIAMSFNSNRYTKISAQIFDLAHQNLLGFVGQYRAVKCEVYILFDKFLCGSFTGSCFGPKWIFLQPSALLGFLGGSFRCLWDCRLGHRHWLTLYHLFATRGCEEHGR